MAFSVLSRVAAAVTVAVVAKVAYENKDWIRKQIAYVIAWIQEQLHIQPSPILLQSPDHDSLRAASDLIDDQEADPLRCPISHRLLLEAVITPYGHCFNRSAIEDWLKREQTCPITRQPLYIEELKDCSTMRFAVEQYIRLRAGLKED